MPRKPKAPKAGQPDTGLKGPVVIQLVSLVSGDPHSLDGTYVVQYHPGPTSMPHGHCLLRTTPDILKAKVYANAEAAHSEWTRVDNRRPVRPDGQPNRPMTAWNVVIQEAPPQGRPVSL